MNATSPGTQNAARLHLHIVAAGALSAIAISYFAESTCAASNSPTSQSEISGFRVQGSGVSSSVAMSSTVRSPVLVAQQTLETTAAVPTDQSLESQYYQEYQSVVVPTQPSTAAPPQIAPPPQPQPTPPPPLPQFAPPPSQSTPLPPTNQPASLNEPIWVMPSTAPPASTQPVKVPSIQPWTPPPVSRPTAPVQPTDSPELAVQVTDVQLAGVEPELQQYGLRAIQTKPGGQTSPSQLRNDVAALLNTGFLQRRR
ncbi:MAG: hypothetical protein HC866_03320 [Leptolyngbyaceae cyanobacterium RU_5_1]|nr:hypothetical protein [Leptolyngbyaceae cyanobacterium RU_5_1]